MNKNDLLTFMIPGSIDLDRLAEQFDPASMKVMRQRHKDSFAFIIGTIFQRTLAFLDDDQDSDELWIYISALDMRAAVGESYNGYRNFLVQEQIINWDDDYVPDVRTFGFQIAKPLRNPATIEYYQLQDFKRRTTVFKLLKAQQAGKADQIKYNYWHLENHFKTGKLMIHEQQAREWVEKRLQESKANPG
ncbi:MAG: hypothetical protein EOO04_33005, partial [Chitinophagaceae bacterium]